MSGEDKGVDGLVELRALLDALGEKSALAAAAPRSKDIYSYIAHGQRGEKGQEFNELAEILIRRLGIWWSEETYAQMPVLTPWCARDRSCRYDQGPEAWGSPRPDGYLRDDNSIIKKLPLPVMIEAGDDHPYAGRKPWRGFTACHVWRDLSDGVGGEDPWLYSFVPNLVWLPSWIAPLSDRQGSPTQHLLQAISLSMFRNADPPPGLHRRVESNWARLTPTPGIRQVTTGGLARFQPTASFFQRRLTTLRKFTDGCDQVLAGEKVSSKIVCSRYTSTLPTLDRDAIAKLRDELSQYAETVGKR